MQQLIEKFCPEMHKKDAEHFVYALFPFIYGIYPYTAVNEKQRTAMKTAKVRFKYQSIYQIAYHSIQKLLA